LVIDSDAVLALAIAGQGLETVAWNGRQVRQPCCRMEAQKPCQRLLFDTAEPLDELASEYCLGFFVFESADHRI
jgi:hypothetical protein